ncbi:MAG: hypothetical protein HZA90_01505 [Verrucomicrobia bacterium]|nr:hypothetical protein [Verrucomicrobiota bacterium]
MSRVLVQGWGAVSPAGWGVPAMRAALERGEPLSVKPQVWPGSERTLTVREVPPPSPRPAFFGHPRLRRASPITHYAAAATLESLEVAGVTGASQPQRLGLIVCMWAGCVHYSYRFLDEALQDPATASPMLFPETVFNAPTSHVAVLLGRSPVTCTLLGDPATYLQALALGAEWLEEQRVDGCLVVGAEETNWLLTSVLWYFDKSAVPGGGAGALYLENAKANQAGVELSLITDPQMYSSRQSRVAAACSMRRELPASRPDELLCDSRQDRPRTDAAEDQAWQDWFGSRLSPKKVLGDGLMASGAWQCVAACEALARGQFQAANVSVVGSNQQAMGARFVRNGTASTPLSAEPSAQPNSP